MITMLIVLGLIIYKASQPATWAWLASDVASARQELQQPATAAPVAATVVPEPIEPGPTDLDADERGAAAEEFQAITDGSMQLGREEMPAYWRLFQWTEHQSLADMQKRSTKNPVLNQFLQNPEEQRGGLFTLDLNVRRVLAYDAPPNPAGIKKVYEIWGWTTESQAWLYVIVTAHLPPGMPIGPNVHERARVAGYFLKVQGYQAAGAGPKDKPLKAPLLVGRVSWAPSPLRAAPPADLTWLWWLGGVAVVFGILRGGLWLYGRLNPRPRPPSVEVAIAAKGTAVRDWLATAEEKDSGNSPILRASSSSDYANN